MAEPKDVYNDQVRRRLAEIRASAGVPSSQVSLEVLYMLPGEFLRQYEQLFGRALKADGGEAARNGQQQAMAAVGKALVRGGSGTRPNTSQVGPSARGNGRRFKKSFIVQDERALRLKSLMDKRLRRIAQEIDHELAALNTSTKTEWVAEVGSNKRSLQCHDCKMFLQYGWQYCPQCGLNRDAVA